MRPTPCPSAGRKRRRALGWAVVALLLSLGLARLHDYRGWDQSYYLAVTSSLAEDGDVDPRNDFLHIQREPSTLQRLLTTVHANGAIRNMFAIGSSVLWLPAYGLSMPLRLFTSEPTARWSHPQLVALQLLALAFMVWLLWILDRWLRHAGVGRGLAALAALALVLGTPLLIYGFRSYTGSHLGSALAVMLLLMATLRLGRRGSTGAAFLWGVAVGLVFLCRWQDAVKGALLLVPVLQLWRRGLTHRRWLELGGAIAVGALTVGGLQIHAWLLERGGVFSLPQGSDYIDLTSPELGRFLFSGLSGLLPWSPLFAIGLIGLLLPWRARLPVAWRWVTLALLLFDIYFNSTVVDWWGGVGYGSRRMSSDVPLLAIGLANLASWRRLRLPLAAALVACCLWGAVTANLRLHGLRDLGILVHGELSSAPGAQREGAVQPSPAEARRVAASWPFGSGKLSYFAGTRSWGRPVTVAIGVVACLLAGLALGGCRAPRGLGTVLLVALALVLFAHLRLLTDGRGDPEERRLWRTLSEAVRGRTAGELPPRTLEAVESREDGPVEARRLLHLTVLRYQGRNAEAWEMAAAFSSYPFGPRLLQDLSLPPGERRLLSRQGLFHRVHAARPERSYTVTRRVGLTCEAIGLRLEVEKVPAGTAAVQRLISFGRGGETPLARVETVGGDEIVLRTPAAREESPFDWGIEGVYTLALDWDPLASLVVLRARAPDGSTARLEAPASLSPSRLGRLGLVTGGPSTGGPQPPWGTRFSNLWMSARNVCAERGAPT